MMEGRRGEKKHRKREMKEGDKRRDKMRTGCEKR